MVDGHGIVGDASTGACGGGDAGNFQRQIDSYFGPKIYFGVFFHEWRVISGRSLKSNISFANKAGVIFSFIAAVQGTILLVGAYIIFFVSKKDIIDDGMDKDFRRPRDERL